MRKLIYNAGVSADGFIAGPSGEFDWLFTDQDYGIGDFVEEIDCTVMGRKSFEIIQKHDKKFFDLNRHYVFTSSLPDYKHENVIFTSEDAALFVKKLKLMQGKSIWLVGGGTLAGSLLDAALIDELLISYHPVVLGTGIPLFRSDSGMSMFETRSVKNFDTGLIQVRYQAMTVH